LRNMGTAMVNATSVLVHRKLLAMKGVWFPLIVNGSAYSAGQPVGAIVVLDVATPARSASNPSNNIY
jgi:hypothetical protein